MADQPVPDEEQVPSAVLHGRACRYCHQPLSGPGETAGEITDARIYGRPYPIRVRACFPCSHTHLSTH
ncbi:hypothetical protein [Streptomyces aidingensis]|uniref:Uncharacterized protein n=1 Tax=Streptomyces aidingensis TaxID=910347 RepID=A0A1I1TNI2_9ACTN|nr:hypothetical protein [Streptomyces aidingensis]SFD60296.1 hypothetical protein SAMN05421773_12068 [Streptomyces aidingensis]